MAGAPGCSVVLIRSRPSELAVYAVPEIVICAVGPGFWLWFDSQFGVVIFIIGIDTDGDWSEVDSLLLS
jgi:hypothetical protein